MTQNLLSDEERRQNLRGIVCTLWGKNWGDMTSPQRVPIDQCVYKLMTHEDTQKRLYAEQKVSQYKNAQEDAMRSMLAGHKDTSRFIDNVLVAMNTTSKEGLPESSPVTPSKDNSARDINVPTKDDELLEMMNELAQIVGGYAYSNTKSLDVHHAVKELAQFIKQREEQVALEVRINELNYVKDNMTRWGIGTIDPNDIATRITQLTTTHKGDQ